MTVAGVQVNDGSAQRSLVRSLTVTFSGPVTFAGSDANAAIAVQPPAHRRQFGDLAAAVSLNRGQSNAGHAHVLGIAEIDPLSIHAGTLSSLADGFYSLSVFGSAVTGPGGFALDGDANGSAGGDYVSPTDVAGGGPGQLHLFRLFGDVTGDGFVAAADFSQFRIAFGTQLGDADFNSAFDLNGDGFVAATDFNQFKTRFGTSLFDG